MRNQKCIFNHLVIISIKSAFLFIGKVSRISKEEADAPSAGLLPFLLQKRSTEFEREHVILLKGF